MPRQEHGPARRRRDGERPGGDRGPPRILTGFAGLRRAAIRPANDNRSPPAALLAGAAVLAAAAGAFAYLTLRWMS